MDPWRNPYLVRGVPKEQAEMKLPLSRVSYGSIARYNIDRRAARAHSRQLIRYYRRRPGASREECAGRGTTRTGYCVDIRYFDLPERGAVNPVVVVIPSLTPTIGRVDDGEIAE